MSDLEREELNTENNGADDVNIGVTVEQTESGTLEQRTRIDGHHRHHHHKHHSKAYYKCKKIKHKIKKQFRSKKTRWAYYAVIFVLFVALVATSMHSQSISKRLTQQENATSTISESAAANNSLVIKVSSFNTEQLLVSNVIGDYFNPENDTPLSERLANISSDSRLDISKPVELKYTVSSLPSGTAVSNVKIVVSENSDFSQGTSFEKAAADDSVSISNLKTGTKYYYSIDVFLTNEATVSTVGSFVTAASPRIISVDGVSNVRDIGGWQTKDGRVINQGLLFRGNEIDAAYCPEFRISDKGIVQLTNELRIITDFDLRGKAAVIPEQSPLGASVKHLQFGIEAYNGAFEKEYQDEMRAAFSALADKSNYPMYMHCTYGLDRTGTVCYILEALLGLSEEDLIKEYELSCLYYTSLNTRDSSTDFMQFLPEFNSLEGADAQEKAQNYLLSIGITQEEINSIKNIFLG